MLIDQYFINSDKVHSNVSLTLHKIYLISNLRYLEIVFYTPPIYNALLRRNLRIWWLWWPFYSSPPQIYLPHLANVQPEKRRVLWLPLVRGQWNFLAKWYYQPHQFTHYHIRHDEEEQSVGIFDHQTWQNLQQGNLLESLFFIVAK